MVKFSKLHKLKPIGIRRKPKDNILINSAKITKNKIIKWNVSKGLSFIQANKLYKKYYLIQQKCFKEKNFYQYLSGLNPRTDLRVGPDFHSSIMCKFGFPVDTFIKEFIEALNENYQIVTNSYRLLTVESCENASGYVSVWVNNTRFIDWINLLTKHYLKLSNGKNNKQTNKYIKFIDKLMNVFENNKNLTYLGRFRYIGINDWDVIKKYKIYLSAHKFGVCVRWQIQRTQIKYYTKNFQLLNKHLKNSLGFNKLINGFKTLFSAN